MIITNSAVIVPPPAPATNAAPAPVFHDVPKPLIYIPNGWALVFWVLALLAAAAVAYAIFRWWRKKVVMAAPPPLPPHVLARMRLDQALRAISEPKQFSILVSDAIREYLEKRFEFHAPDRTTEEFLHELQGTRLLTLDQKSSLGEFLASCDLIKFAKYEPTEMELRGLHASALRLVNETEPRPLTGEAQPASRGVATPPPLPATQSELK